MKMIMTIVLSVMMRYSLMVWVGVCWIRELVAQGGEGVCLARAD